LTRPLLALPESVRTIPARRVDAMIASLGETNREGQSPDGRIHYISGVVCLLGTLISDTSDITLNLMITSRFDAIDRSKFKFQSVQDMLICASEADIKLYLDDVITSDKISDHFTNHFGEATKQKVVNTIAKTADGMYATTLIHTERLY
jgi:hypothetical protein